MTIRCVVVGWGAVSRHMLRAFEDKPWYETVAVVDTRPEALAQARETHPQAAGYPDLAQALAGTPADVVIINTPSHLHFEQAVQALERGLHVLVAKPVTNDFDQAVQLVELAARQGVTLSVGQQMRYMRHYQALAHHVASGALGSVEAVNFLNAKPRPNPANLAQLDQPALYEMSCHHFDSLAAVLDGHEPETISCDGFTPSWSRYAGPCMVNAWIRYSGGVHVLYQGGFSSQAPNYEVRLEGSTGALRCRGQHMSIDDMVCEQASAGGSFTPSGFDKECPVVNPWSVFADVWHGYLTGGQEPPFSGRLNLKALALLSAAIESSTAGGAPVAVAANPRYAAAFVPVAAEAGTR